MATCTCCGCVFASDYGTSVITGSGEPGDEYIISEVDASWIRPAARVRRTTDQTIATGGFAAISFDTEVFDTNNFWVVGSPTIFTIGLEGIYSIGGCIKWAANVTGTRELAIRKNGTTILNLDDQFVDANNGGTFTPWQTVTYNARLSVGDSLELLARQESGGNLNVTAEADDTSVFWIVYLGKTV